MREVTEVLQSITKIDCKVDFVKMRPNKLRKCMILVELLRWVLRITSTNNDTRIENDIY